MAKWFKAASAVALAATAVVGASAQGQQGAASAPASPAAVHTVQQPAPAEQGGGRFKSAVDLVSVAAIVRDRKGRFVPDLSQKDFTVVEAGESRPIVGFRAEEDGPVRVAIVLDVSGSMGGRKAAAAREAARHLLSGLGPNDQAALFSFDSRLDCVRDFTSDFESLLGALDHVNPPFGRTSLYDAVAETARTVVAAAAVNPAVGSRGTQRAAIVVLTDGVDTGSRLKPEQVSAIASGIDVPVYVMAVMSSIDDPRMFDDPEAAAAGGLRDLARWTGGELFTMSAPAHTSIAARQIVGELRHQYLLAFEASVLPGWRPLEVKARSRDLTVRARSGYAVGGRPLASVVDGSVSQGRIR